MLTVETGAGLPNADSYASVAFADTFHASLGNTKWATFTLERKEQLMRIGANYITYIFGSSFAGAKAVAGQSLSFPRTSRTNYNLYSLGVPREVQEANAELALIADSVPLVPNTQSPRKRMVKVGPITVQYDGNAGNRFSNAVMRLNEFLNGASANGINTARLVRT